MKVYIVKSAMPFDTEVLIDKLFFSKEEAEERRSELKQEDEDHYYDHWISEYEVEE